MAKIPISSVLRTQTTGEKDGFMKALIATDNGHILGFTMIGPEAGEVMAVVQMVMQSELSYTSLRDAVLTHPTMAEGPQRPVFFGKAEPRDGGPLRNERWRTRPLSILQAFAES